MVKNAIRISYKALRSSILKFMPPIDLKGIGEIIVEDIAFQNNQGITNVVIDTSGTINGKVKVIGELMLNEAKDKIILDVQNIEFIKLPLALKLTAGLLKQKIMSVIESKANISDQQLQQLINSGSKSALSKLSTKQGISADLNLTDLKFVYVITDNEGIEICTELKAEPRIEINELPSA